MIEHKSPISGIAASGVRYVATAGYDNQVILWDAVTQRSVARGLHDHLANQVRFSPCGRYLLSSSSDASARLWEVPTMRLVRHFGGHGDDVEAVAFSPCGTRLATASRDALARVFSLDGILIATMQGHGADVISVEWTADGRELITSSDDGTVKRWCSATGAMLEDIDLGGIETDTIVITGAGTIYAGNDDGAIIIIKNGERTTVTAHASGIKRLVLSEENRALVSLSYDRKVRIWRLRDDATLEAVATSDLPTSIWPRSCAFVGPDRVAFATFGSSYATLALDTLFWDVSRVAPTPGVNAATVFRGRLYAIGDAGIATENGAPLRELPSLCNFLCPFGDMLLAGGQTGEIFDALSGRRLHQHRSPLNCATAFTRDGLDYAIVGAYTGEGIVLRRESDGSVTHVTDLTLFTNAVKGVASDDAMLFAVCATGASKFLRLEDFALLNGGTRHDKIANGCAALGKGRFASVSRDLMLRLWEGGVPETIATPHEFSIKCVAACDRGDVVASGSYGGYVALFHVPTRTWMGVLRPTAAGISSLAFDPGRGCFLASSYDGRIYAIERMTLDEAA